MVNSQKASIISLVEAKAAKMRDWPWRMIVWENMAAKSTILPNERTREIFQWSGHPAAELSVYRI